MEQRSDPVRSCGVWRRARIPAFLILAQTAALVMWCFERSRHRVRGEEGTRTPYEWTQWHTFADDSPWMWLLFTVVIAASIVALARRPLWGLIAACIASTGAVIAFFATDLEHFLSSVELADGGVQFRLALLLLFVVGIVAAVIEVLAYIASDVAGLRPPVGASLPACASSSPSRSSLPVAVARAIPGPPRRSSPTPGR